MEVRGIVKAFPKVKRQRASEGKDGPPPKKKADETMIGNVFQGLSVHIITAGIGKARYDIFHRQITQNGGQVESTLSPRVTHVVVEDSMEPERALRLLKVDRLPPAVQMVKCAWLSACIAAKTPLDTTAYSLIRPDSNQEVPPEEPKEDIRHTAPVQEETTPQPDLDTTQHNPTETETDSKEEHAEEDQVSQNDLDALINGHNPNEETQEEVQSSTDHPVVLGKWVCAQSSKSKGNNHNSHITEKLEVLAKAYTHQGDRWRALSYSKAINALKSYHKPITSFEEACKIPGIGRRMADKITEITDSGHLRKLDHISESVAVLELFSNIWGAGAKTAQLWYQQGFRTLEDIRTKANLNHMQKIGLKHYDDFLDRMPREEAAAIEKTVRQAACEIDPGLIAQACGSYRRGKATCGDVDVLISHPNGKSHKGVFSKILHLLHQSGFLTDDLVSHEESGDQKKYMGVCRLPGPSQRHRRLDIIVVPYAEFACSLMYFTGSAHFNRSMRALAKTKHMSLSEHSLNRSVVRQGTVKLVAGTPLPTLAERDVFAHLGIPFREPQDRDW